MAQRPRRRSAQSGGCLLALAIFAGVGVGLHYREPSIGFLAGAGTGLLLLLLVYLIDRGRG
jgi:hypothetical protein